MSLEQQLQTRANQQCELCGNATTSLVVYELEPARSGVEGAVYICESYRDQITGDKAINPNDWRCLNDTIWSEVPAVQVLSYRMLHRLKSEGWTQELLDMMYLDEETRAWAEAGLAADNEEKIIHKDSNGAILEAGDTVTLIKDLNVKGANFTAKRGTAVRRISLVADNAEHIEGKIEGQRIVILTQYVKKQGK
ncbi:MAG: PhnA domain-containing protein [Saprospiraceae bacterium]